MNNELLIQISKLSDVFIAIFVILLLANLNSVREYVKKGKAVDMFKTAWHFLRLPAWQFFTQFAEVGKDGTYLHSYQEHKQLHTKVRRFLGATVGFTLIKVLLIILGSMIFGGYLFIN